MIDPRKHGILIWNAALTEITSQGDDAQDYRIIGETVEVTLSRPSPYGFNRRRIVFLRRPKRINLAPDALVDVDGVLQQAVHDLYRFSTPNEGRWIRVFRTVRDHEVFRTYPESAVRILTDPLADPGARDVLKYLRAVVAQMPAEAPLRKTTFKSLSDVHPDSALARYLTGRLLDSPDRGDKAAAELIFPFGTNISQREAVETALTHPVSVIDGPPGTGKTQSILSIVANIVREPGRTVCIVSHANAAVENVRDKLTNEGFGVIVADLGNAGKQKEFFENLGGRSSQVQAFLARSVQQSPDEAELADLGRLIHRLQHVERECAEHRAQLAAFTTERRHFQQHVARHELPDLSRFPLLRRSSRKILRFLAESELLPVPRNRLLRILGQIRRYLQFGTPDQIDPADVEHVLALQLAFYDKKIAELEQAAENSQGVLDLNDFNWLVERHRELSQAALYTALAQRYQGWTTTYDAKTFTKPGVFEKFVGDYPVVLSTCQSLRRCIRPGYLFDYLIIDEASQVDLPSAVLALSCARHVVVVGDEKQLPHIPAQAATHGLTAPASVYDYDQHNILSSVLGIMAPTSDSSHRIPRTMLREHYRCDPAIIDFCNRKFYDEQLIPMTEHKRSARSLALRPTAEGNHMRKLPGGGGTYNVREAEVIAEVLPEEQHRGGPGDVGVVTPYRMQVDQVVKLTVNDLDIEVDTVHKYQGREKPTMILTTVLDESRQGHFGIKFVDNPNLVNVAVSRAAERLVVVTNSAMLPRTQHLRELLEYIRYQNPNDVVQSKIVSIFDLLYREYSPLLEQFARRVRGSSVFQSENAAETALREVIAGDERYSSLKVAVQVPLAHLVRDPELLAELTDREASFRRRASVDLVVFNRITLRPVLVIEVDGHTHKTDPKQIERDQIKNAMLDRVGQPWLRLSTDGSGERDRIKERIEEGLRTATAPTVPEFGS
ncbi:AAA domain-containing protein [Promicromonospora sp. Populi]|uniref:AAA domain-containing protein n=1 Tax=Promicromonospora sp. Populi TaxID=3239420 RepID=UPI0034E2C2D1